MHRWTGLDDVPPGYGPCVVTIGMFDGVHSGHSSLLARAVTIARERGLPCVLMTFQPHPVAVLTGAPPPARLTTLSHKLDIFAAHGVDAALVLPFTAAFAAVAVDEFVDDILVTRLQAAAVVVGDNFTYGHRGAGTTRTLTDAGRAKGFVVDVVGLVDHAVPSDAPGSVDGAVVSATRIRALVAAGDVEQAHRLLGRPFRCDGVIVRGKQRGRAMGYPTANVDIDPDSAVPADGVYAGRVVVLDAQGGGTDTVLGTTAISVGTNPTFDGLHRTVEAYILDFDGDLYGQRLGVEFWHHLRGMVKYTTIEALIEQMDTDVVHTRQLMTTSR